MPPYFYAVARGKIPGVYDSWEECKQQTDGFIKPRFKKFPTREEAVSFVQTGGVENNQTSSQISGKRKRDDDATTAINKLKKGINDFSSSLVTATTSTSLRSTSKKEEVGTTDWTPYYDPLKPRETLYVYTDGSCLNNGSSDARGGIGVFFGKDSPFNLSESYTAKPVSNNIAELYAVIRALQVCLQQGWTGDKVVIHINTDSQYVINCVRWCKLWKTRGWMTTKNERVANIPLIQTMYALVNESNLFVTFHHVYGHASTPGNIEADRLAVQGSKNC